MCDSAGSVAVRLGCFHPLHYTTLLLLDWMVLSWGRTAPVGLGLDWASLVAAHCPSSSVYMAYCKKVHDHPTRKSFFRDTARGIVGMLLQTEEIRKPTIDGTK